MTNNPKVILIGGASYVGKSTLSLVLGSKLNIKQIVDIDVIREVLRGEISKDKLPYLHYCSTTAWQHNGDKFTKSQLILSYNKYCKALLPSVKRIIDRAYILGKDTIIEGVHILPSLYKNYLKRKNLYVFIITSDEKSHLKNLERRRKEFRGRRIKKYYNRFPNARVIQDYLIDNAKMCNVGQINNSSLNQSIKDIIKIVGGINHEKGN